MTIEKFFKQALNHQIVMFTKIYDDLYIFCLMNVPISANNVLFAKIRKKKQPEKQIDRFSDYSAK